MINDPYPGTPNHQVLMIEAFGDHQVANISTETEARTIGAFVRQPAIAAGRSNDVTPMWGFRRCRRIRSTVRCSNCGTSELPRHPPRVFRRNLRSTEVIRTAPRATWPQYAIRFPDSCKSTERLLTSAASTRVTHTRDCTIDSQFFLIRRVSTE